MAQLYATEPHYIRKLYKRTFFEGDVVWSSM
jgi:hypothetical protein